MSTNGQRSPLAFAPPNVPILGQPFEVAGLMTTLTLVCKCSGRALLVTSQAPTQCPSCKKGYLVVGLQWTPNQPPQIQIHIIQPDTSQVPADAGVTS